MAFDLPTAWTETTAVVAAVYGVPLDELRAPSRGRGPKPRAALVEPRKVALYLVHALSEADYAEIGRHVGLSRDTVMTHVAAMREKGSDGLAELSLEALEGLTMARLRVVAAPPRPAFARIRDALVRELEKQADQLSLMAAALSDEPSDAPSDRPATGGRTLARAA